MWRLLTNLKYCARIMDELPQPMWITDEHGIPFYLNQAWDVIGISAEDFCQSWLSWEAIAHSSDLEKLLSSCKNALKTAKPYRIEARLKTAKGEYRWFLIHVKPILNRKRWVGSLTDIHELKESEIRYGHLAEAYESFIEASPLGIVVTNDEHKVVNWNRTSEKLFGWKKEEVAGKDCPLTSLEFFQTELKPLLKSTPHAAFEFVNHSTDTFARTKGGYDLPVTAWHIPYFGSSNHPIGVASLYSDRSSQKEHEDKLQAAIQLAETANEAKSVFLANMSHEIRTPLNAITGFADLLCSDLPLNNETREKYKVTIKKNTSQLLCLVEDILDLSKIEADVLRIHNTIFSPHSVFEEIVMVFEQQLKEGVELQSNLDNLPKFVEGDATRLRQILYNLVSNAVKFTEAGFIRIKASFKEGLLTVWVQDSGVGINPNDSPKLFKAFGQADQSITKKYGGTGLGLILSKKIAEKLGGSLQLLESTPNIGSTFYFEIPLRVAPARIKNNQTKDAPLHIPSNISILIAEDSEDNRNLIRAVLTRAGVTNFKIVENGQEALEEAEKNSYDVIVLDIQMPILDGISAAKILRQKGFKKPLIALTAHAMKEYVENTHKAGFDAHLTKPIVLDQFVKEIYDHLNPSSLH
jgi:PAS domain S-box-containing protein